MDTRREIRDFLLTRRAQLTPEDVGLPSPTRKRRVPGLRREEAAALAGVSVDYYTRLERGDAAGASDSVLEAVSRALALDDAEHRHLVELMQVTGTTVRPHHRPASTEVTPSVQRMLDSMGRAPAFVSNSRLDLVATNSLCAALYADLDDLDDLDDHTGASVNLARYTFLDPRAREFYPDWDEVAEMTVALLRSSAGHDPSDRRLTDLIADLAANSESFRTRWASHHVRRHTSGWKRFRHPVVGELELAFDSLTLSADPTLTMTVYTAEPGTPSDGALHRLASLLGVSPPSHHSSR